MIFHFFRWTNYDNIIGISGGALGFPWKKLSVLFSNFVVKFEICSMKNMLENPGLQDRETKSSSRNSDDVVVDGGDQEPKGLGHSLGLGGSGSHSGGGVLGIHAGVGVDAHVGQLAVIGRPKRIQADEVK